MARKRTSIVTTICALAVAVAGLTSAPALADGSCDLVRAPGGSDVVNDLLDDLRPGQTGCLRAGTYAADQFVVDTGGIRLMSYPGETATLRGRLRINASADAAVVEGLKLDGRNPDNRLGPLIYADRVVLRGNDITNYHTAICVHIDSYPGSPPPQSVVIERNRIHDCGRLPATNHDHGIYIAHARGTIVRGNWIYNNADRGVQLYPDADGSLVTGNVIDGNGQGVIFSGGRDSESDNNLVTRNVITNSTIRYNVESHWQGDVGRGNVARRNCVWGGARDNGDGGIESPPDGFQAVGNVIANPHYVDRAARNFNLRTNSRCLDAWVKLSTSRRKVKPDQRFKLRGRIRTGLATAGKRAVIQVRRNGRWKRVATARVSRRNRFKTRQRARASSGALRYRAKVRGVGRSRQVRVKLRR